MTDSVFDWNELIRLATVGGVVWSASWFLFRQTNSIKELVYRKFDEVKNVLLDKLEYHEHHDDERFKTIRNDIISIRLENAARTGKITKYETAGSTGGTSALFPAV